MGTNVFLNFFILQLHFSIHRLQVIVYYSFLYYNTSDRVSYYKKKKNRQAAMCLHL